MGGKLGQMVEGVAADWAYNSIESPPEASALGLASAAGAAA
jgi:hypothetical protein